MVTSSQALKKYGQPSDSNPWLTLWDVPTELEIGVIPKRIYCNKDMVKLLLASGAKVKAKDQYGLTALVYALKGQHVEIVKLIKDAGGSY